MANILETIIARKREELERLPRGPVGVREMKWAAQACGPRRDFIGALRFPPAGSPAVVAEVKKASPSAGEIRSDFDPVAIARMYVAGGASAISVLTDQEFFKGSMRYLREIRDAVRLPLLRKDFLIDPRQVLESLQGGADAVLLIASVLDDEQLRLFRELAEAGGLAALVEVHDEREAERALASGARLIGINNRDLETFQVDLGTTERVANVLWDRAARAGSAPDPAAGILLMAESGIRERGDVDRLEKAGVHAILVGESLLRCPRPAQKIRELIGLPVSA